MPDPDSVAVALVSVRSEAVKSVLASDRVIAADCAPFSGPEKAPMLTVGAVPSYVVVTSFDPTAFTFPAASLKVPAPTDSATGPSVIGVSTAE